MGSNEVEINKTLRCSTQCPYTIPGQIFLSRFLLIFPSRNAAVHSSGESFGETSPSVYNEKDLYIQFRFHFGQYAIGQFFGIFLV
jgi:hypothetical protein